MSARLFRHTWLLACVCISAVCASLAQTAPTEQAANTRGILLGSINAMGGTTAWQSVHGLTVQANITSQYDSSPHSVELLLDWSTGVFRYVSTVTGPSGTSSTKFNGTTPNMTTLGGNSVPIPEPDPASLIGEFAPAASIERVLSSTGYSVALDSTNCPKGATCIDISRQPGQFWKSGILQLQLSSTTFLPIAMKRRVPLISTRGVARWETLTYGQFQNENGLMLPSSIVRDSASARPSVFNIQVIATNPAVSAQVFAGGTQ
jgi:hypothetical protein